MILRDVTGRNDSGILVEYKGHRILNTVDSQSLSTGALPRAKVLLTSFAGGASGYPLCWDGYSKEQRIAILEKKRQAIVLNVLEFISRVKPQIYVPFAGYFTEAHPSDIEIKQLNIKNTAQDVCRSVQKNFPGTITWIPNSGGILDVGSGQVIDCNQEDSQKAENFYGFEPYLKQIRTSLEFGPLETLEGIEKYFRWAGFEGNLVLHVLETTDDFQDVVREFYVDFCDLSFPDCRPVREHRYLRMRCRSDVFRYVLRYGLPWEEISIGFQARFFRDPDIYNFDFWDHFQNKLPQEAPW
jgi:CMP-N-acetylneuraminate monooxygenase